MFADNLLALTEIDVTLQNKNLPKKLLFTLALIWFDFQEQGQRKAINCMYMKFC